MARTLADMSVPFNYYRIDHFSGDVTGPQVHEALKTMTNQRTVPYVYVNGRLLGGCDATKASIAEGEFDKLLGAQGNGAAADLESQQPVSIHPKTVGVDESAPNVLGALFEFPNTVDMRVIRLIATQVFVLSVLLAALAYKKESSWRWVSVGVLTDFCLRFYGGGGISPLGSLSMFLIAMWDLLAPRLLGRTTGPVWGAGPPKQFAVSVGVFFAAGFVVFYFTRVWIAATVFAAILAFFSGLEAFVNFCAGCWVFGHAIRFGIVPDTVYIVHVNTLPETKYAWDDFTKQIHPKAPVLVKERFRDHPAPTRVDLFYKTGKTSDWEREDFDYIKHSKSMFFSSVIGVVAIPAMFKFMSMSPRFATPDLVWQILTILSLIYTVFFTAPYLAKMIKYPHKVKAEWHHPAMNNAFSMPSMILIVYAFLATGNYSTALARVLWWAGCSTSFVLAVIIVGNWMATMRHEGHFNGAWLMSPVGLYIASVVGPIVDVRYTQISYLFFGFASIMYITLFVIAFQRTALGHNADPRQRMFSAIWFAAPAVAGIAWTVLNSNGQSFLMDPIAQTLFYIAISMGTVNLWMAWRRFLWADRFFMQMWAFGFPTAGLAWSAILYDATVGTALSKVLAVVLISLACVAAWVLIFRTFTGVARLKVFIPEHKWGPMSHLPLAQDAMRELLHKVVDAGQGLAADPSNARLRTALRTHWATYTAVNTFYCTIKRDICLPQIGDFFPGHQAIALANNARLLDEQAKVDALISEGPKVNPSTFSTALEQFSSFAHEVYDQVEDHIRPVVRRYIPGPVQKKIMVDCWDDAPPEGWWQAIPAVVQHLPMQSDRLTYIRAFLWAMPERCQQIGTMVALGTDPVTWYRLRHAIPDMIPRGEAGWKRF